MKGTKKGGLNFIKNIFLFPLKVVQLFLYMFLIFLFVLLSILKFFTNRFKFLKGILTPLEDLIYKIDNPRNTGLAKMELINLAMQNMLSKKNRTMITIGGMAVGIAAIVFLVSIGYGLELLVVNRVARLEELKQAEVSTVPGSNVLITDESLKSFADIPHVDLVMPQISVVGKVNYNNSLIDTTVYGVTKDYLEQSAISPVSGEIFENNDLDINIEVETETYFVEDKSQEEDLPDGWVELEGESGIGNVIEITKVIFPEQIKDKEVVVNRAFLKVLNLEEQEAIDKTFSISFIATISSLQTGEDRLESTSVDYKIIGVTPDDVTPLVYVPYTHLKVLGIDNLSQVKIVVEAEEFLANTRTRIESLGYTTSSVTDTVEQINSLFATLKIALASIGTVALFVAALGMFNTLTVSLLERVREIGLLKTMGMKSNEVRDLFLAESMIMGSLGGVMGLIVGLGMGKLIEIILSVYAVTKGVGEITIVNIPIPFALLVIILSFLVGVFTGLYPARRATKISALNALRYE